MPRQTRKVDLKKYNPASLCCTRKRVSAGPPRYYSGLTRKAAAARRKEILKFGSLHWKNPRAYVGFKTDRGVAGKPSNYTQRFRRLFPNATSLTAKAKATGVPVRFLRASYNRGMAAWRTGHRPGATEQQWGYARVHSLLLCGKTAATTDSDIVRKAKAASAPARKWFTSQGC
jgi:hypothetical protein